MDEQGHTPDAFAHVQVTVTVEPWTGERVWLVPRNITVDARVQHRIDQLDLVQVHVTNLPQVGMASHGSGVGSQMDMDIVVEDVLVPVGVMGDVEPCRLGNSVHIGDEPMGVRLDSCSGGRTGTVET